jgi:hypothetical protein
VLMVLNEISVVVWIGEWGRSVLRWDCRIDVMNGR